MHPRLMQWLCRRGIKIFKIENNPKLYVIRMICNLNYLIKFCIFHPNMLISSTSLFSGGNVTLGALYALKRVIFHIYKALGRARSKYNFLVRKATL